MTTANKLAVALVIVGMTALLWFAAINAWTLIRCIADPTLDVCHCLNVPENGARSECL